MATNMRSKLSYMDIASPRAMGRLLAEYAVGYRLPNGKRPPPEEREPIRPPTSLAEFADEIDRRDIGTVREDIVSVQIVQPNSGVLLLVLPPKDIVEEAIDEFASRLSSDSYELEMPDFYRQMILAGRPWPTEEGMNHLPFWYCRLSDYTLSFCG